MWHRDVPDTWFYVVARGGVWTHEFKGVEADCISVFARPAAKDWCDIYAMPKSKSFAFTRYDEAPAIMLVHEWHRLLHHFFGIWHDEGQDYRFRYSPALLDSFVVSDEFAHWAADLPVESFAFRAVHECMMARPRG